MLFGRKKSRPAEIARGMREQALSLTAADLNLQPIEARPHVWGAIMELGYARAVASLCAFADGTVSLYISTGGGIIGAGEQPTSLISSESTTRRRPSPGGCDSTCVPSRPR